MYTHPDRTTFRRQPCRPTRNATSTREVDATVHHVAFDSSHLTIHESPKRCKRARDEDDDVSSDSKRITSTLATDSLKGPPIRLIPGILERRKKEAEEAEKEKARRQMELEEWLKVQDEKTEKYRLHLTCLRNYEEGRRLYHDEEDIATWMHSLGGFLNSVVHYQRAIEYRQIVNLVRGEDHAHLKAIDVIRDNLSRALSGIPPWTGKQEWKRTEKHVPAVEKMSLEEWKKLEPIVRHLEH